MLKIGESKLFMDDDSSLDWIRSQKIGIIGFGNQGRAQALNLKDSGANLKIGLREKSSSAQNVMNAGLISESIESICKWANVLVLLIPDEAIPNVYNNIIKPNTDSSIILVFAHGYSIHYQTISLYPNQEALLISPSGPGKLVRKRFLENSGVPSLISSINNSSDSIQRALSYSKAIGCTRICAVLTTFSEETESDLFGEQTVLTGGIPHLIINAFDTLVNKGFQPIIAWLVCFYEVKLIVDLFSEIGLSNMQDAISTTAVYGGQTRGERLINHNVRNEMGKILDEIQENKFFDEYQNIQRDTGNTQQVNQQNSLSSFAEISRLMLPIVTSTKKIKNDRI
jgi:ketol-acid reductoisomerase